MSTPRGAPYRIGVIKAPINRERADFDDLVDSATARFERVLADLRLPVQVHMIELPDAAVSPYMEQHQPLDLLQIGMTERVERKVPFVLVITDVRLLTARGNNMLLPSPLTNVGLVTVTPLEVKTSDQHASQQAAQQLADALLHTLGHLLNLPPSSEPGNVMYRYAEFDALTHPLRFTPEQVERVKRGLPREARDEIAPAGVWFRSRQLLQNLPAIVLAAWRANPLRLLLNLRGMLSAASVFGAGFYFLFEFWDFASASEVYKLLLFGMLATAVAVLNLYAGLSLRPSTVHPRLADESVIVTRATTFLALALTMLLFYLLFALIGYLGSVTIFPRLLAQEWPTVDPVDTTLDRVKAGLFLAGVGVLVAPLGGVANRRTELRQILFLHATGR